MIGIVLVDYLAYFLQVAYKPGCLHFHQVIYTPATESQFSFGNERFVGSQRKWGIVMIYIRK